MPTPTLAPNPTATPTITPTATSAPTLRLHRFSRPTPTTTPTPMPTLTPTPTPTQIPGRPELYVDIAVPEHLAYTWWGWNRDRQFRGGDI